MSRLKTFGKYLLMFVAFYIFVTVASIGFIKGTYETMEQNVYSSDEIQIEVDEAKSTFVNGYVKGKLTNNSDSDIHSKYVKINFLSKKGNVILTKYLDIDELKAKETKNFTINFEAENIKSFNMSIVDEYIQEKSNAQLINLSDAENEEIFIIGGGKIYDEFISDADKIYLTEIDAEDKNATVYFPHFDKSLYKRNLIATYDADGIEFSHVLYSK